jgi:hypothetical protein
VIQIALLKGSMRQDELNIWSTNELVAVYRDIDLLEG